MAGEDITPNVVLTADNSQYDSSMTQSAGYTDDLMRGIDKLTAKLDSMSKSGGRKLLGISAADTALVTGATAAWAAYEKQMSRLQAQAAVVTRTRSAETKVMQQYTDSVKNLRKEYGTTTGEAAMLTQTVAKMTGTNQVRGVKELTDNFTQMSNATGESSSGLATSLLNLNKVMGTSMDPRTVKAYSDQITTLAASSNTTAAGLADFAAQIAPTARLIGLNQTAVTGVSKAFIDAGQDGYQAATAFNQIVSGIAQATASGSPDLAKYANLIGSTVEQFKGMSGQQQIVSIFDKLSELGPKASVELNRLGLDGVRTMRAITAVTNQSGGLGAAIGQSQAAFDNGAVSEGSAAAMKGMTDELGKLRQELQMTAENLATIFGPAVTAAFSGIEKAAGALNDITSGPLGELLQMLMAAAAPVAAFGGGILLMAGALLKLSGAFLALRNSGALGVKEGFQGGSRMTQVVDENGMGRFVGDGGALGKRGQEIAEGGTWVQRGLYNTGAGIGGALNRLRGDRQPARSAMSMVAGGTAALFNNYVTPQLDQMAYSNPAQRKQWANRYFGNNMPIGEALVQARENTTSAQDRLSKARGYEYFVGASGGDDAAKRKAAEETRDADRAHRTAVAAEAATMARAQADLATARVSTETTSTTARGFAALRDAGNNFGKSLVMATGQLAKFGAQAGLSVGKDVMTSRVGRNTAALGAGVLLAQTGLADKTGFGNTLSYSLMGGVAGPWGAAAGAALGFGKDIAATNDDFYSAADTYDEQVAQNAGLADRYATIQATNDAYTEMQRRNEEGKISGSILMHPKSFLSSSKNTIEGIFGDSDEEEADKVRQRNESNFKGQEEALRRLAAAMNVPINGDMLTQLQQLDEFGASLKPQMDELGISIEQLGRSVSAETPAGKALQTIFGSIGLGDSESYKSLESKIMRPGEASGLWDRISKMGTSGSNFINNPLVQGALEAPDDAAAQYRAINAGLGQMLSNGMSLNDIAKDSSKWRSEIGDDSSGEAIIAAAIQQQARFGQQLQSPLMSRGQNLAQQVTNLSTAVSVTPTTNEQASEQQTQIQDFMTYTAQQGQYFQQLLLQQREFNVSMTRGYEDFGIQRERMDYSYNLSRSRAQTDFHLQRKYQEQDYQLSRERAEFDYTLQRERGVKDYERSMKRSTSDFNLSRERQEEDYQHSVMLMQEQAAQQLYNIYERVEVKRTSSAGYLLVNAQDQLDRMQEQSANLDKLRKMGLSDDAIQQLGLTDSSNAQQLARLTSEASPALIKKFNRMVRERLEAAAGLVTDESSKEWQEFQRQYRLSRERAADDFEKQISRSHRDFDRQMDQMEDDFRRSMDRQATDYETAQERQQKQFSMSMARAASDYALSVDQMTQDFNKSMTRAQADMNRSAKEISGSLEDILVRATEKLSGSSQKQAEKVLRTFRGLSGQLGPEANSIMSLMSEIFGFKFTPVKTGGGGTPRGDTPHGGEHTTNDFHDGGVLPGRSIGRDNMHYYSPDHGRLSLAGGEAIMVPEWTDAIGGPAAVRQMNAAARAGRFRPQEMAEGGVVNASKNPDARVYVDGEPMSAIAAAQLKLAEALGKRDLRVMQGSWQPYTSYSGTSHMGPGVMDTAPGDFQAQGDLRRVGFAAWGRNFPGAATAGSGAHVHSVSRIDPGARNHAQLSSFARGEDGLGGADYGPNPPMLPNLLQLLGRFMNIGVYGGGSGGGQAQLSSFASITKDVYPALERAAAKVRLLGGFPEGWWSKKLNQTAREKYDQLSKKYTASAPGLTMGVSNPPSGVGNMNNREIVHKAMQQFPYAESHWSPLEMLVNSESGFNNTAQNPTSSAYGLFQFLDGTWGPYGPKTSDPWKQSLYGMKYIHDRYENPTKAWDFKKAHNWYGTGAVFQGSQTIGVGDRGPELVMPLDGRGLSFISELLVKTQAGLGAKALGTSHSSPSYNTTNNYHIDRSTNFTGAITVQANNPMELMNALKARNKVRALSQASLGGVRI